MPGRALVSTLGRTNPYIVAQALETVHTYAGEPSLPHTPSVAQAYELGMLDATFGQSVSFPATSKLGFRIEVPVWSDIDKACRFPEHQSHAPESAGEARVQCHRLKAFRQPAARCETWTQRNIGKSPVHASDCFSKKQDLVHQLGWSLMILKLGGWICANVQQKKSGCESIFENVGYIFQLTTSNGMFLPNSRITWNCK